jgi:hypothetical protein
MLARKVVAGKKTVTRRRLIHRGGRPIRYKPNQPYAVQPGRGKRHVGHIVVEAVREEPLRCMDASDARAEGFPSLESFRRYWAVLHGGIDLDEVVAVIEFLAFERKPCCVPLELAR